MKNNLYNLIIHVKCWALCIILLNNSQAASQNNLDILQFKVDSLLADGIDKQAFPGAQVLIIHKDAILMHKAYGHHTYDEKAKVQLHHLYDLASVTKIMAGGLSIMKLEDEKKFQTTLTLQETHPFLENSDKANITWQSILAHQSRMEPYIVFWQKMKRRNGKYKWRTFTNQGKKKYPIAINDEMFLHQRYPKLMHKHIKKSPLKPDAKYLYSGLGFLLIPEMVKERSTMTLDEYLQNKYFEPMGLKRIKFKPSDHFEKGEIVPTEIDTFFRHKLVQGYVHDENASMLDGVSANAGLFSNAEELGKISTMLLNDGKYEGQEYLSAEIVQKYTSVQFPDNKNRRGLAFDKPPLPDAKNASYMAPSASPSSFGHSGFTGTFMWLDPEYDLIVIFLSNRVYPYRSQQKLYSLNFRPQLHQLAYDYVNKEKH